MTYVFLTTVSDEVDLDLEFSDPVQLVKPISELLTAGKIGWFGGRLWLTEHKPKDEDAVIANFMAVINQELLGADSEGMHIDDLKEACGYNEKVWTPGSYLQLAFTQALRELRESRQVAGHYSKSSYWVHGLYAFRI